jgi:glycosyltransferase involved in cell wall biosynthesis
MKISVIIANYNYDRYLASAINSVFGQTYLDFEIVIVDDGSTDRSHQVIAQMQAKSPDKIKVILQANQGHGGAINTGFQNATGEIVAFLDSDDVWKSNKLEQLVRAFEQPEVVGVIHPLDLMNSDSIVIDSRTRSLRIPNGNLAKVILDTGSSWRFPPTSGLAFRRNILQNILPMDPPEWRFWPDGCLLYCSAFLGKIVAINEVLGSYRIHGANTFFSAEPPTRDRNAKAISGVDITSQWLNQFLERIDYPERVDLSRNLDHRRAQFYLQGKWDFYEVRAISEMIATWHFYTWTEKLKYLIRFWLKSTIFLIHPNTSTQEAIH